MPNPFEHPTPRPSGPRVVDFRSGEAHDAVARSIEFPLRLAAFSGRSDQSGQEQWLGSFLAQLGPGEALTLRIALGEKDDLRIGVRACGRGAAIETRGTELATALELVLACAMPDFKLTKQRRTVTEGRLPGGVVLQPRGRAISLDDLADQSLREVAKAGAAAAGAPAMPLRLRSEPGRRPDLAAVAALLSRPELRGARLTLSLAPFRLDAAHSRAIQLFLKGLSDHLQNGAPRLATLFHLNEPALAQLKQWCISDRGLHLGADLAAPDEVAPVMLDMLCQALFGDTRAQGEEAAAVDLTTAWPDFDLSFLARLPAIPAAQARLITRQRVARRSRSNSVVLGRLEDGSLLRLDHKALEQHVYAIGGTGTGKSTLMLNMIVDAMQAGRAVLVIDPHGDLYEKALRLVPPKRRDDLVLMHPTDPRGAFTLNALERQGDDLDTEYARIVDELLDLFKRTLWPNAPEAFGPMFENYFRNGILLLLYAQDKEASIVDLPRMLGDGRFRAELLSKCANKDVAYFWRQTAVEAGGEAQLDNVAPYIVAKLAPFIGNATLKRILGANHSTIDLRRVIARQQICLINLAQPHIGKGASRFLGGIITARLIAAAKTQVALPPEQRLRIDTFMDEFQSYISAGLADGLAEVRKFGLNLMLANQSLSQLHGDRYQAEVAEAVMANAANVIAFRVGLADAVRLGLKFEPTISVKQLIGLPNYHAAATLLQGPELAAPVVFAANPEPRVKHEPQPSPASIVDADPRTARIGILRALARRYRLPS